MHSIRCSSCVSPSLMLPRLLPFPDYSVPRPWLRHLAAGDPCAHRMRPSKRPVRPGYNSTRAPASSARRRHSCARERRRRSGDQRLGGASAGAAPHAPLPPAPLRPARCSNGARLRKVTLVAHISRPAARSTPPLRVRAAGLEKVRGAGVGADRWGEDTTVIRPGSPRASPPARAQAGSRLRWRWRSALTRRRRRRHRWWTLSCAARSRCLPARPSSTSWRLRTSETLLYGRLPPILGSLILDL